MSRPSRERFREIDTIFDAALDLAPDERDAFVTERCGDDVSLRAEVRAMLDAHTRSRDFLEAPAVQIGAALLEEPPAPDQPVTPMRAGAFRIVREIGRGGMGVVYLAARAGAEFEQRVALKVIRQTSRGTDVVRRFLEERRILALLEHPGIARLVDGGVTDQGDPYFAMEFVDGLPVDEYCDSRQLGIEQRLDVFGAVCDAVQYAHEHLVIHRDLKPSNILVRDDGQLKLLDFGIAKLLDPLRDDGANETQAGLTALTPEYAAPEQIRGKAVSTATDTYALGVLLYVLLAGRRPYDVRGRLPSEVEHIVCDLEPLRPSLAAPENLRRRLDGDLDLIVMKALHKDPARRYPSAVALHDDLRRYRRGLPVLARPDSARYRLAKFARRHRTGVAAATMTLAALLGATAFSATQMREAKRQRDAALREVQRQQALVQVQNVLAGDARDSLGRPLSAVQRIGLAEQVLSPQFRGKPWLITDVLLGLASRLYDLGERQSQRAMLSRGRSIARDANLPTQLALVDCMRTSSLVYDDQLDSARADLAEAQAALARPGAQTDLASAMCLDAEGRLREAEGKPDSAVALLRRALALTRTGGARDMRLQMTVAFGTALRSTGHVREASEYYRESIIELDSTGYRGTDILPNVVSFLTSALGELGEIASMDSLVAASMENMAALHGHHASGQLNFLRGLAKLRLGELDSADVWIGRAMRDTTEGAGGLTAYLPPAITQLRLEQGRLAEARMSLATLPSGTLVRRINRTWLTARVRYADGDTVGGSGMLEDSLRAIAAEAPRTTAPLALPFVTAAEWRLEAGDARGADSLAQLGRMAGAVDSISVERSGYVGRAELVRARALSRLGHAQDARRAAERALVALTNGYGASNRWTLEARAIVDSVGVDR